MCTVDKHEADKTDPAKLATSYIAHDKPWLINDEVLYLFTCRACLSTVAVEEKK